MDIEILNPYNPEHRLRMVDPWQEKYERILKGHENLQRLNQTLEEKLLKLAEDQARKESNEKQRIEELTQRLVEARILIHQLEDENERYRNDINVVIKLLQCKPGNFISPKIDSLPEDLQKRVLQKHGGSERRERKVIKVQVDSTSADLVYAVDKGNKGRRNGDSIVSAAIMARVFEERENERKENQKNRCKCSTKIPLPTLNRETQTNACAIINYADFVFPDDMVPPLFPLPLQPQMPPIHVPRPSPILRNSPSLSQMQSEEMSKVRGSQSHPSLSSLENFQNLQHHQPHNPHKALLNSSNHLNPNNGSGNDNEIDDLIPRLEKAFSSFRSSSSLSSPSSLSNNSFASLSGGELSTSSSSQHNGGVMSTGPPKQNTQQESSQVERRRANHCVQVIDEKEESEGSHWVSTVLVHPRTGLHSNSQSLHFQSQGQGHFQDLPEELDSNSSGIGSGNASPPPRQPGPELTSVNKRPQATMNLTTNDNYEFDNLHLHQPLHISRTVPVKRKFWTRSSSTQSTETEI